MRLHCNLTNSQVQTNLFIQHAGDYPAAQERIKKLLDQGFHQPGDVEERLGYRVGDLLDGANASH